MNNTGNNNNNSSLNSGSNSGQKNKGNINNDLINFKKFMETNWILQYQYQINLILFIALGIVIG